MPIEFLAHLRLPRFWLLQLCLAGAGLSFMGALTMAADTLASAQRALFVTACEYKSDRIRLGAIAAFSQPNDRWMTPVTGPFKV